MKLTREMQAVIEIHNAVTTHWVDLALLVQKARSLGVKTTIRERLALAYEHFQELDRYFIEELDALAAQQEATHE